LKRVGFTYEVNKVVI